MGIFLRQSYNIKPLRWGSPADVQYAIKINAEKIYQVDPDSIVLAMPLFWGLPPLDYSGKNNNGTNHGTTYKDGSLNFDGVDDYVDLKRRPSLEIPGVITVAARLKLNSDYTTAQAAVGDCTADGGASNYVLTFGFTNNKYGFWNDATGSTIISTATISDNNWHYIVVTRDGVVGDWDLNIYIDGDLDNTVLGSPINPNASPFGYQAIGRCGGYPTGYKWNGFIDEVCISNVTRTADQIALFHNLPYGLYQPVSRPIWLIPAAATTSPPTTVAPTTLSPTSLPPTTSPPTSLAPTTLLLTTLPPTTLAPTTTAPTTLPPTTPSPTTLPPTLPPTTVAPTTLAPTTLAPTTAAPTTLAPTTLAPTSLPPTSLAPTSLAPTTLPPTTLAPTTLLPTTLPPTSLSPTTTAPTSLAPTTLVPTTAAPTSLAPTTLEPTLPPTTLAPTTVAPTTTVPTSLPPTTLGPTTLPPTTLAPTTAQPTTLQPTTLGPTTIAPTTLPPTTLVPTTDIPEAICIKTCDSLITSEIICYAPITEEILCYGNLC